MPLLPWLPASRKKRFPVTKRSPKVNNELIIPTPEANEKVSKDLQGIFGGDSKHGDVESSMKMKRSSENTHALLHGSSTKDGKSQMENVHVHEAHKKQKRDVSVTDDSNEAENDNGMFNLKTLTHNLITLFSLFSIHNHANQTTNKVHLYHRGPRKIIFSPIKIKCRQFMMLSVNNEHLLELWNFHILRRNCGW